LLFDAYCDLVTTKSTFNVGPEGAVAVALVAASRLQLRNQSPQNINGVSGIAVSIRVWLIGGLM
jgi:hypothetical protein